MRGAPPLLMPLHASSLRPRPYAQVMMMMLLMMTAVNE